MPSSPGESFPIETAQQGAADSDRQHCRMQDGMDVHVDPVGSPDVCRKNNLLRSL